MPPRSNSYTYENNCNASSFRVQWSENFDETDSIITQPTKIPDLLKSVRFSEHVDIFAIKHIDDFTAEEIAAVWDDERDSERTRKESMETIYSMEIGAEISSKNQTARGLEHRTREGARSRFQHRKSAYSAVLDEQDNQWNKGIYDCDAIAQVYIKHSAMCSKVAVDIGQQDATDVKQ